MPQAKPKQDDTPAMEQHPLALQVVPGTMSDAEFDAFCEDVKKNGQQFPIIVFENKVLDGWHRYRACRRNGMTPDIRNYEGDDPVGLIISANVHRRKLGSTQRALAGARLNIDYNITQDEAAKRVGVSKVHVNLVVQAIKSKNSRLLKALENSELTREQLHAELQDAGVIKTSQSVVSMGGKNTPSTEEIAAAAASSGGLQGFFSAIGVSDGDDDDLLGDGIDDDMLGAPPSANGKVLANKGKVETTEGGMPIVGSRPSHPERRSKLTQAQLLLDKFKAHPLQDRESFVQIAWPHIRPIAMKLGLTLDKPNSPMAVAEDAIIKAAESSKSAEPAAPETPAAPAGKRSRKSKA